MKCCCTCKLELPTTEFYKDKRNKDGLYLRCKKCHLANTAKWAANNLDKIAAAARNRRAENPEKHRAYQNAKQAEYYAQNPEKYKARTASIRERDRAKTNAMVKASREKNPEYMPAYLAAYYEANKDKIKESVKARAERLREELKPGNCERVMRRNARKIQASPGWANVAAMQSIYSRAALITKETGIPHHVDHIVPLQSKKVCGLHVEHNLQILPRKENQEKSNRWWPDAP